MAQHADDPRAPFPIDQQLLTWAQNAHKNYPKMTSYGFPCAQVVHHFKPNEKPVYPKLFNNWANDFTERDAWMVGISKLFLQTVEWNYTVSRKNPGSYGLKHTVERWAGSYIYEGALLLAAVQIEVPLKRYGPDLWGAFVGVSRSGMRMLGLD